MIDGGTFFIIMFGGSLILTAVILILWHILHLILCKKYDSLLFKEPHFRFNELAVYSSWPLSLFRSMGYILLIALPTLARKRRFKDVKIDFSNGFFIIAICRIFLLICILDIIFIVVIVLMGTIPSLLNTGH